MAKKPYLLLLHILDAINQIASYIDNYTLDQFRSDRKTQDAVIRQLEIIGEASAKLESTIKADNPKVPWTAISDFRNVLAHQYWDIDMEIVWKAASQETLELKSAILPIIESLNS